MPVVGGELVERRRSATCPSSGNESYTTSVKASAARPIVGRCGSSPTRSSRCDVVVDEHAADHRRRRQSRGSTRWPRPATSRRRHGTMTVSTPWSTATRRPAGRRLVADAERRPRHAAWRRSAASGRRRRRRRRSRRAARATRTTRPVGEVEHARRAGVEHVHLRVAELRAHRRRTPASAGAPERDERAEQVVEPVAASPPSSSELGRRRRQRSSRAPRRARARCRCRPCRPGGARSGTSWASAHIQSLRR